MTVYTVKQGDTFEIIAARVYGLPTKSDLIIKANPFAVAPLTLGTILTIPDDPDNPPISTVDRDSTNENEVSIFIENDRFRFWQDMTLKQSIDTIDSFSFNAPFDPENKAFRDTFVPFSYKPIAIKIGGVLQTQGVMLTPIPSLGDSNTVNVSGYARCGVLNDCPQPATNYPIEFNDVNILEIAKALARPFGIKVSLEGNPGLKFDRVAKEPSSKTLAFIAKLSKQRNFYTTSDATGDLLLQQSIAGGNPVARFDQGSAPLVSITPSFNPQGYYSSITGIAPFDIGDLIDIFTVKNPFANGFVRPKIFKATDIDNSALKASVESEMGRMFANAISWNISGIPTWRDDTEQRNLWKPNTTITVLAPRAMIYKETEMLIRSVTLRRNADTETASLNVVLPGAFAGKIPGTLPWLT